MPYFHFQVPSTISIVLSCGGEKGKQLELIFVLLHKQN